MDAERFDDLTKTLTTHLTRRLVLGSVGGLGFARLRRIADAKAKNKNGNKKHRKKEKEIKPGERCKKNGNKLGTCVAGADCNKQGYCKCRGCHYQGGCAPKCGGTCCDAGESCCLDLHQNTVSCRLDDLVCGECRDNCPGGCCGLHERCIDGLCRSARCPPPDWYVCGATCCFTGYTCCHGGGVDYCCDPGLQCSTTGSAGCM